MENEILNALVNNGPWAMAAVILFRIFYNYVITKDSEAERNKEEIKCIYEKQIDKYIEIINKLNDEISEDIKQIKLKIMAGGKK